MVRGKRESGCEMPNAGYVKFTANGTNIKKDTLRPIKNSSFSTGFLVNFNIWTSKNPGRKVSRTKPKTCLKIGMSRAMRISVKAMNDSVKAHNVLESKLAIAPPLPNQQIPVKTSTN
jgi:hypothetical protein